MIHATAVIHPKAQLHPTVRVGPYAVIDADVVVGAECEIGPHAYLTGVTQIGPRNRFYVGAVIGEAPQDLKYKGEPTALRIGTDNIFREYVTVHRSANPGLATTLGDGNLLMAHCHIGHDTQVGSKVIIANGALFGGHVVVEDGVIISGNCLLHQFVRVGSLAMMQGGSAISKDLPPFVVARGDNGMCGLNIIGLRRAGFTPEQRLDLKRLYHFLFRGGRKLRAAVDEARGLFPGEPCRHLIEFVSATTRGICHDTSRRGDMTDPAID